MIKEEDRMILLLDIDEEMLGRLKTFRDSFKETRTINECIRDMIETELWQWEHTCTMFDKYEEEDARSEKDCMWEDDTE